MDESVTNENENVVEAAVSAAGDADDVSTIAADTAAPTPLDLNELQQLSSEELKKVAREFDVHLSPMRSTHQQIVDLVRPALGRGATVTARGFLDLASDSFGMLRYPALNFLHVPEDVFVTRAIIQQFHLRAGQTRASDFVTPGLLRRR